MLVIFELSDRLKLINFQRFKDTTEVGFIL